MNNAAASTLSSTILKSSRLSPPVTPALVRQMTSRHFDSLSSGGINYGSDDHDDGVSAKTSTPIKGSDPKSTLASTTTRKYPPRNTKQKMSRTPTTETPTSISSTPKKETVKRKKILSTQPTTTPASANEIPRKKSRTSSPKKSTVERTTSFEPAWWGNVLATRSHPHVATKLNDARISLTNNTNHYPPVHTLILGTHPSITSFSKNEFYGHSQNAFWYLAGDALQFRRCSALSPSTGKPYVYYHDHLKYNNILDYPSQLETIVSKGFALWDIIQECEREGSLDVDIEHEVANPVREFCEGGICNGGGRSVKRIVIANGTTGSKFFLKYFKGWFLEGKLCAAGDEMSQKIFKSVMNQARKVNGDVKKNCDGVIEVVCLPGVSPAAAKFTYLEKRAAWNSGCFEPGLADYDSWMQQHSARVSCDTTASSVSTAILTTPTRQKTQSSTSNSKSTSAKSARKIASPSPSKAPATRLLSSDIAKLAPGNDWVDLKVAPEELRPSSTLTNGQCFNWMVVENEEDLDTKPVAVGSNDTPPKQQSAWGSHDAKEWIGPLGNRVLSIKETPTTTLFRIVHGPTEGSTEYLQQYFRLETALSPLYKEWSKADDRLSKIATAIPGVRILRQEPVECMFSFICSSNNNIPRITKMLAAFREKYGTFMIDVPSQNGEGIALYTFPTIESLSEATEDELRGMGLGYRAKYITETRDLLVKSGGEEYLIGLRSLTDAQVVQDELTKFSGIGRKVADCVALFSLDQDDAIPVDVHVQHIASRDYDPTVLGGAKSLTPTIYKRVGDLFRSRFDTNAGWAHSLLFVAELPSFRGVLPTDVVKEMDEVSAK